MGHGLVFPSLGLWLHRDVDRSSALRLVVDTDFKSDRDDGLKLPELQICKPEKIINF